MDGRALQVLKLVDSCQDEQGADPSLQAKLDVGVEAIPNHAGPARVNFMLGKDRLEHVQTGLSCHDGLAIKRRDQRRKNGPRAGKHRTRHWKGGVGIGGDEEGPFAAIVVPQVLVGLGILSVADVSVEAHKDSTHLRVRLGETLFHESLVEKRKTITGWGFLLG